MKNNYKLSQRISRFLLMSIFLINLTTDYQHFSLLSGYMHPHSHTHGWVSNEFLALTINYSVNLLFFFFFTLKFNTLFSKNTMLQLNASLYVAPYVTLLLPSETNLHFHVTIPSNIQCDPPIYLYFFKVVVSD